MRTYSRFNLQVHSIYKPEIIINKVNDFLLEYRQYVINSDMKLFKIPIDDPIYFILMEFVKENKDYFRGFYQQYEKSFSKKEIDSADVLAITSGFMLCGYDNACTWDYFARCCAGGEFTGIQCKDYEMPPKDILRKQLFDMDIYRLGVAPEVKNAFDSAKFTGISYRPIWSRKNGMDPAGFQLEARTLPPLLEWNKWEIYKTCPYCGKIIYKFNLPDQIGIPRSIYNNLTDFNETFEEFTELSFRIMLVSRNVYMQLNNLGIKRLYVEPIRVID